MRNVDEGQTEFNEFRKEFTEKLHECVEERLVDTNPLYKNMRVIDNRQFPLGKRRSESGDGERYVMDEKYGNKEISDLAVHYSGLLIGLDLEGVHDVTSLENKLIEDWCVFKADILRGDISNDKVRYDSFTDFWVFVNLHYERRYPYLTWLVKIIRIIPMGSAECERMFSLMNRLKTDLRNRIKTGRLNQLMTVNRLGPTVEEVTNEQLDVWIDYWDAECTRGRYTSYFQ